MGPGPIFCLNGRRGMGQTVDKERLIELIEPPLAALGFELEDCERVSEQLGAWLDVEDPLPGSYVLEVSSPGFDRRLRTLAHFERFAGERAKLELRDAREGRRKLTGRIAGTDAGQVLIEVDGEVRRVPLNDIAVARLAPPP